MTLFQDHKQKSISQAEDAVDRAWTRLQDALAEFEALEREWQDSGSGFVSRKFRDARKEAANAQKWYEHKVEDLAVARREAEAPTLWDD